ncbi:aspartyl/asparaginyl beta-hydroxylase domain-containing protein [Thalassotalea sp. M1531]|uniref:Aspartyl/asparaginyl beta-hydroxylase domain-containing protein n=1 Tax=Thalassotalea algicola TaxID=2716224 RepID=A0A7Y0LH15_9GAMM|nr:aspartyl/asparaginyl beta-hydroxylase domain-containing protein [Thalassotalea algicola]NMP33556.1 aspartyl/asparaginyl beta-hydroxylase domain-containing protein [Thalassotalea algicola]
MDAKKLPIRCSIDALLEDLKNIEREDWLDHFVPDNYSGEWQILTLRGPKGETHPIRLAYSNPNQTEFEYTPLINFTPNIRALLEQFNCTVNSVRLMKLTSKSIIKEHSDYDLEISQGNARLHIPLVTHPDVNFVVNNQKTEMKAGECWYLNLAKKHYVENFSPLDRIHLVIDVKVNDWLSSLMTEKVQNNDTPTQQKLSDLAKTLLNQNLQPDTLEKELSLFVTLLLSLTPENLNSNTHQNTQTTLGVALSPENAFECAKDFIRTIKFMRGLSSAIVNKSKPTNTKPVEVIYAGCGPLAIIAMPIILLNKIPIKLTVIDIHKASIDSVQSIIESLDKTQLINDFLCNDIDRFIIKANAQPDVILLEIMQAGLENEAQVALSKHLLKQAPEATIIPQKIEVDAIWVDPKIEFSTADIEEKRLKRTHSQNILAVDKDLLLNLPTKATYIECKDIYVPQVLADNYTAMLKTEIKIYDDISLKDNESGLTSLRIIPHQFTAGADNKVSAKYYLCEHPYFDFQ